MFKGSCHEKVLPTYPHAKQRLASQSHCRGLAFAALAFTCLATSSFAGATTQPVKDVDAPARKPFQTALVQFNVPPGSATFQPLATVPANRRLVIEYVSGACSYVTGYAALESTISGSTSGFEYLSSNIFSTILSSPIKFYANPGEQFGILVNNVDAQSGYCSVTATGYYVNLP